MIGISKQAITQSLSLFATVGILAIGCKSGPESSRSNPQSETAREPAIPTTAKPEAEPANAPAPTAKVAKAPTVTDIHGRYPAEYAAWDMSKREAAWQGAWSEADGQRAFEVRGDKAVVVDATSSSEMTFSVDSPCTASFSKTDELGLKTRVTYIYVLQAGKLLAGPGVSGSRTGNNAVFCNGFTVFTFDGVTCTAWTTAFDVITAAPGNCGLRDDGKLFFYSDQGPERTAIIEGEVIWSDPTRRNSATPHANLAAAIAAAGL